MPTTPEDIVDKKFPVTLRGYDPREVESFLAEIAGLYRDALNVAGSKASPASFDHLGQEVSAILKNAVQAADGIRSKAQQEATSMQRNAKEKAVAVSATVRQEANAQRDRAAYEAEQILAAASAEAEGMKGDALRRRSEMLEAATQRHEDLQRHERELRARIEAVEVVFRELRAEMEANQPPDISEGEPSGDVIDLTAGSRPRPRWDMPEVQPRPVFRPRSESERG